MVFTVRACPDSWEGTYGLGSSYRIDKSCAKISTIYLSNIWRMTPRASTALRKPDFTNSIAVNLKDSKMLKRPRDPITMQQRVFSATLSQELPRAIYSRSSLACSTMSQNSQQEYEEGEQSFFSGPLLVSKLQVRTLLLVNRPDFLLTCSGCRKWAFPLRTSRSYQTPV